MIIIIYLLMGLYFVYDYIKDPKTFKILIVPGLAISYLSASQRLDGIDNRISQALFILVLVTSLVYLHKSYHYYKVLRFREKKRLRAAEERERLERELEEAKRDPSE